MTFRDSFDLTFPILLDQDPKNSIGIAYQILTIPTTYFIDSNGYIQRAIKGPMNGEMLKNM